MVITDCYIINYCWLLYTTTKGVHVREMISLDFE